MKMNFAVNSEYKFPSSFGLSRQDSLRAIKQFLVCSDWEKLTTIALEENLMQKNSVATAGRTFREIKRRLKKMSYQEMVYFLDAPLEEQNLLIWLTICRNYQIAYDFLESVIKERYEESRDEVTLRDFDSFMQEQSLWHEEINLLSEQSYLVVRKTVMRWFRELGVLSKDYKLEEPVISSSFFRFLQRECPDDIKFLPISRKTLRRLKQ